MELQTHRIPGLVLTDHEFSVPLDYARPGGNRIKVFAREVVAAEKEGASLPWLLWLQGGPGIASPRPTANAGWLKRALERERERERERELPRRPVARPGGTGRSTPVTHQTLVVLASPQEQADYLKHFRADNIVRDAEAIRQELLGTAQRWSVLGQSYGGFLIARYLSAAPEGLKEAIITAGLPPLDRHADDVYRATYRRLKEKNRQYFERYPDDVPLIHEIVDYLAAHDVRLPGGGALTIRRFQQLGRSFGFSDGFEQVHYLLDNAFVAGPAGRELSYLFLREVENTFSHETFPDLRPAPRAVLLPGPRLELVGGARPG